MPFVINTLTNNTERDTVGLINYKICFRCDVSESELDCRTNPVGNGYIGAALSDSSDNCGMWSETGAQYVNLLPTAEPYLAQDFCLNLLGGSPFSEPSCFPQLDLIVNPLDTQSGSISSGFLMVSLWSQVLRPSKSAVK